MLKRISFSQFRKEKLAKLMTSFSKLIKRISRRFNKRKCLMKLISSQCSTNLLRGRLRIYSWRKCFQISAFFAASNRKSIAKRKSKLGLKKNSELKNRLKYNFFQKGIIYYNSQYFNSLTVSVRLIFPNFFQALYI